MRQGLEQRRKRSERAVLGFPKGYLRAHEPLLPQRRPSATRHDAKRAGNRASPFALFKKIESYCTVSFLVAALAFFGNVSCRIPSAYLAFAAP